MKILLALAAFLLALAATSQSPYHKAIGIRFPGGTGITFKKFVTQKAAMEFQALYAKETFRLSGLYEFHFPFAKVAGLHWYVGPGVHAGFYKSEYQKTYSTRMDIGIDGVIGLDYKFEALPLNLSLDWQPAVSLSGNAGSRNSYGGVAVRYTL